MCTINRSSIIYYISWKLRFWAVPKGLPYPALCQKRCVSCFCFPRKKKHFFMKKIFFRILHYSTALPESSPIMNFHDFWPKSMKIIENQWKSWFFMEIDDFHDRARLWQSRRVVQNAKKYFFIKKCFFFLGSKNTTHIVSGHSAGYGSPLGPLKTSIFTIYNILIEIRFIVHISPYLYAFWRNE